MKKRNNQVKKHLCLDHDLFIRIQVNSAWDSTTEAPPVWSTGGGGGGGGANSWDDPANVGAGGDEGDQVP